VGGLWLEQSLVGMCGWLVCVRIRILLFVFGVISAGFALVLRVIVIVAFLQKGVGNELAVSLWVACGLNKALWVSFCDMHCNHLLRSHCGSSQSTGSSAPPPCLGAPIIGAIVPSSARCAGTGLRALGADTMEFWLLLLAFLGVCCVMSFGLGFVCGRWCTVAIAPATSALATSSTPTIPATSSPAYSTYIVKKKEGHVFHWRSECYLFRGACPAEKYLPCSVCDQNEKKKM
jgi:hypothetical protein